ncbi:MAG TPA: YrdB family protein [Actinomycetota bacterium]
MMPAVAAVALGLRFLLEVWSIVALVGWGLGVDASLAVRVALGVGAAGLFGLAWGRWVAPRASRRLADPARLVLELALFAVAAAATWAWLGRPAAVTFATLALIDEALLFRTGTRGR